MKKNYFIILFLTIFSCILYSQSSPKEIIDMSEIVPGLRTDVKYATQDNFTKQKLYNVSKAYGALTMANSLRLVQDSLKKLNLGIKVFDAYRPRTVQFLMWDIYPDPNFVADPMSGSRHNRGSAIDLTLINLKTGKELAMPTPFDDFTSKAGHDYNNLPDSILTNRSILRTTMEKCGFEFYNSEWWHYNHIASKSYPLKDFQMR
jgi:D-alanyl-D-alanine dipeptidase